MEISNERLEKIFFTPEELAQIWRTKTNTVLRLKKKGLRERHGVFYFMDIIEFLNKKEGILRQYKHWKDWLEQEILL